MAIEASMDPHRWSHRGNSPRLPLHLTKKLSKSVMQWKLGFAHGCLPRDIQYAEATDDRCSFSLRYLLASRASEKGIYGSKWHRKPKIAPDQYSHSPYPPPPGGPTISETPFIGRTNKLELNQNRTQAGVRISTLFCNSFSIWIASSPSV